MAKKTKDELLAEASELELDVTEENTVAEIQAALDEHKADNPPADEDETETPSEQPAKSSKKSAVGQARRDAHYAEDGVTEENERLGAQFNKPESQED